MNDGARETRRSVSWRPGKLATNAAHAGAWNGARIVLQAASLVLLARALGAQGYGVLTGSMAIFITVGQFCGLGVGVALVRNLARSGDAAGWVGAARRVYAVTGALMLLPALLLAISLFGEVVPVVALCLLATAELLIAPAVMPYVFREQARERLFVSGGLLTVAPVARVLAASAAFVAGRNDIVAFSLAYAIFLGVIVAAVLWRLRDATPPLSARVATRQALREGAPFAFGAAATTAGNELDKAVLLHALGGLATGHYAAAHRIVQAATLPVNSLVLAATPRLFRQNPGAERLGRHLILGAAGYSVIAGAALWSLAPWLHHVLGEEFIDASALLRWMVPLVVASGLRQAVMAQLTTADLQGTRNAIEILAALLSLAALLAAVPRFGVAAAIATAVAIDTSCTIAGAGFLRRRRNASLAR